MKNFRVGLALGLRTWAASWGFIFRHGLVHFFLYPIVVSIILSISVIALLKSAADNIAESIASNFQYTALPDAGWWQMVLEFFSNISVYVIAFAIWLGAWYLYHRMSKYIVLVLMSPMMSLLSERTEEILTGQKIPFDGQQFVRDVFRGIAISIRNFFMETMLGLAIWLGTLAITFFSGGLGALLSPLTLVLSFCVGAYFYGFSTIDYTNERHRLSMGQSIAFVKNNKGLAVGNGTMFNLLMMLPFLGATIATVTCTVAATLALHEMRTSAK
ncbi:MAG: EI24 domain-containing protein [Flavobacteriales bacterium]